jgi:Holliday junction resolvase RusA-like endonuclease
MLVDVFVPGCPKTKGSLDLVPRRNGPGTYASESVHGSKDWRRLVAKTVRRRREDAGLAPTSGSVAVSCVFLLPVADVMAPGAGDIDKLLRNVLDALTDAGVYVDDVQVVSVDGRKVPASAAGVTGVTIAVVEVKP